ncbi:hypothetical protein A3F07_00780 [candidate division WWE3 bacterium RIFCSPHIGHO2_12_FULL_38_15]|uniref:Polysaccharide biosynthesis protein C-terminal domain-containing protein n=1 Tax=candidate division WWE3 bacterium RIFCSPHIGHO2_02_FULL_38_14 TaxID=1802620 RepID=A0A1F4VBR8_UNCKA|nr:MAG: hypothetical protein A2793_00865 [candidate division WWE3 bacterium RIFCSPHIGHO2_01_FULL_38_45]OGC49109.1 MAG: hypothetical protein A3F07_00780 [candidate division WWE3 bacterium RIFCSPHIGHO2_12_FULL_38_15]OGC53564.1 MAG: hypothetical protein A3B64_04415 [candidate division WWE3 bacterium RIFCSPLOWO2_01_FULL_37_24]OGC54468.1 MAG: hypothetical protein A3D91_01045 [candidate division WWE3 bacterium RIFCSPHIGHO2_02_FULL_38_14]HLB51714.1 oligosaccharide flippase family protein [Patescibacte
MKELTKWQIISFFSRGAAMALGIFQSFFIVRLLTVGEYGVVQLAASIGGAFGIYQHLGLASGSTREISAAKDDTEIFKIFITALVIRYVVTIPLVLFLFFSANSLAVDTYNDESLILPIKIYALVLLFQGVQSILNSVISGTKRFKHLFLFQSGIAVVSVLIFIPLVYYYSVNGYFYALAFFNLISSTILSYLAFKPLRGKLVFPSKSDFKALLKELLSISLAIYFVKILYTWWEKSGPLLLGLEVSKETVGIFAFGLLYAKKLMNISDAVTDVNLPVLSEKFVKDTAAFKEIFSSNFNKIYILIIFVAASAVYWSKDVITLLVGGNKYDESFPYVLPLVFAFVFYSFINIIKSSVIVPAKLVKELIASFVVLLVGTVLFFILTNENLGSLSSMSYAMLIGAALSTGFMVIISQFKLKFKFITHDHFLLMIQGFTIAWVGAGYVLLSGQPASLILKAVLYVIFMLLLFFGARISNFISKEDLEFAVNIFNKINEKIK